MVKRVATVSQQSCESTGTQQMFACNLIFLVEEVYLLLGALAIGLLAAVIPAIQASRTDISTTLTES